MNFIDFTKNGGYRLKQFTFRKMQETWIEILKAFVGFCNIPETGSYIISGMKIVGPNITTGYCYIDGELCRFEETTGDATTKIKKNIVLQTLGFKNGNNEQVFRFVNAQVDATTGIALQDFVRIAPVFDSNYVHTDNNFTNDNQTKLDGIEVGAEKNVQANWNQTNNTADDFIKNKPTGELLTYIHQGVYVHGNLLENFEQVTISFPNPGSIPYKVLGMLVGSGTSALNESRVNFVVREKTATSFKLALYDNVGASGQAISFEYVIVPSNNS